MTDRAFTAAVRDPMVWAGARGAIPLLVPAIPFALVLGLAITESAMPVWIGWSTNFFLFSGAAQLAVVSIASTATWLTLVATATVINLRHMMYSAALSPKFRDQPRWFRWVGPYLLIDQLFAQIVPRIDLDTTQWRRYYMGAGTLNFVVWNVSVVIGLVIGSAIPTEWRLDVAPAVMFASLVAVGIVSVPGIVAAVTGGAVCLLAIDVPNNGAILIGAVSGVIAGYLADVALSDRQAEQRPADR